MRNKGKKFIKYPRYFRRILHPIWKILHQNLWLDLVYENSHSCWWAIWFTPRISYRFLDIVIIYHDTFKRIPYFLLIEVTRRPISISFVGIIVVAFYFYVHFSCYFYSSLWLHRQRFRLEVMKKHNEFEKDPIAYRKINSIVCSINSIVCSSFV